MGLLLQLLSVLVLFLYGGSAAGLSAPKAFQDAPPHFDNSVHSPDPFTLSPADVKTAVEILKLVYKFVSWESKRHQRLVRNAEAAEPVAASSSPDAPQSSLISDEDFAAEIIKLVWEFIWRSHQQQSHSAEDPAPPTPPSLLLASLKPLPADPSNGVQQDTRHVPQHMSDDDFLAEVVKMVWEFMWRGESQAHQRKARSAHSSSPTLPPSRPNIAPCTSTQTPHSSMPVPPCPIQVPLSPQVPHMLDKDTAADLARLLKKVSWLDSHSRRRTRGTETIAELRQLLHQLLDLPKKALFADIIRTVRKESVDDAKLEAIVVGVDEALKELHRQLRDTSDQQEPPSHNRAKRNFTTSRYVDIVLISGMLAMSVIVVIIGNLDPVTQTY